MWKMNQSARYCSELQELHHRMRQLEKRMAIADSRVHSHARRIHSSRKVATAGLAGLLLIALSSLAAPPREPWQRYQEPKKEHRVTAPFEVLDDQENLILRIIDEGTTHAFLFYPAGTSLNNQGAEAALMASIPAGGHVFFKAQTPNEAAAAVFGIVNDTTPTMVLRYGGRDRNLVSLAVTSGKPDLDLNDGAGTTLVDLGQEDSGGGGLMLTNGTGGTIMQAGAVAPGVGTVTVWPQGGAGYPLTAPIAGGAFALKEANRLPGTFICGSGCAGK